MEVHWKTIIRNMTSSVSNLAVVSQAFVHTSTFHSHIATLAPGVRHIFIDVMT